MTQTVLAFDVYGTLIDTAGVTAALDALLPGRGAAFAAAWRQKQLEYTFRRALMRKYQNFQFCTRTALEYTAAAFDAKLTDDDKTRLLAQYRELPAFSDVVPALSKIASSGMRVFAFSNGVRSDIEALLANAGIRSHFEEIVSVDEIGSFKPDPAIYELFVRRAAAPATQCWLVSGNPFDVIGAVSAGMLAVWVRRDPAAIFDPWELEPTVVISHLSQIADAVTGARTD